MYIATDVGYDESQGTALAAGVLFSGWSSTQASDEVRVTVKGIAPYEPGSFYKRELPCLQALLEEAGPVTAVIVDGHVWLSSGRAGLGHYLWEALGRQVPIIGVAKRPFHEGVALPVVRGGSQNPLWVTSVGLPVEEAALGVAQMHGEYRIPTLLKRADAMSRGR